mmetsp:Transcript_12322/g.23213  ORF Transcript_12322/g.23213 Transcript_12322/m.23213 type:complete len:550 (-) Transcript_12322:534-2183(-)
MALRPCVSQHHRSRLAVRCGRFPHASGVARTKGVASFAASSQSNVRKRLGEGDVAAHALSEHEEKDLNAAAFMAEGLNGGGGTRSADSEEASLQGVIFEPVSEAEAEANEKRRLEAIELRKSQQKSEGADGEDDEEEDPFVGLNDWRWTLNWDEITSNIYVGACPRRPKDVEAIKAGTGCTAILCLQSNACFGALNIDHKSIRERGGDVGVKVIHVPIRDFDHGNQTEMIPEAVRILSLLLKTGHKVYVHCTAGINRATLTVVSYLTFVEGFSLDDAHSLVKEKRPQAHPYLDCWWAARSRFLAGRSEEITARSQKIYEQRCYSCEPGTTGEDWFNAERDLIRDVYKNKWECDRSLTESWNARKDSDIRTLAADLENERQKCKTLASKVQSTAYVQGELEATRMEVNTLKEELNIVSQKLRTLQDKEEELDLLKIELQEEKQQVKSLNSELRPLKRNLNEAWRELQRKEKLEMERKNATEQMLAMKSAFEVLHTNLSRSCETIGTSAGEETEGTKDTITPRGRTNGHSSQLSGDKVADAGDEKNNSIDS